MTVEMVGVDVGGTFTDVVGVAAGRIVVAKVPTDVHASDVSVLAGAEELGVDHASVFNLASTAGLNAIITRRIPKVAFLTTTGHRDMLDRGRLVLQDELAALRRPTGRVEVRTPDVAVVRQLLDGVVEHQDGDTLFVRYDDPSALNARLVAAGVRVVMLALERRHLEDVVLAASTASADRFGTEPAAAARQSEVRER